VQVWLKRNLMFIAFSMGLHKHPTSPCTNFFTKRY
jgi:hypothetical protein